MTIGYAAQLILGLLLDARGRFAERLFCCTEIYSTMVRDLSIVMRGSNWSASGIDPDADHGEEMHVVELSLEAGSTRGGAGAEFRMALAGDLDRDLANALLATGHHLASTIPGRTFAATLALADATLASELGRLVEGRGCHASVIDPANHDDADLHWLGETELDAVVCRFHEFEPVPLAELDLAGWQRGRRVNARASWLLAKATVPLLRRRGGSFVALTTRASVEVVPGGGAHGPSKVMESMMLRNVAVEALRNGVRVNLVRVSPPRATAGALETPVDVAQAVGFLLSPAARSINAAVLPVDAGTATAATTQTQFGLAARPGARARTPERAARFRAIVTGGAGRIGVESALALHRQAIADGMEGLSVLLADRDGLALEAVVASLTADGIMASGIVVDLEAPEAPARLVAQAVAAFGGLDLIHSNAALGLNDTALDAALETYERIATINLDATFRFAREASVELGRSAGSLIATSSIAALNANARAPLYAASKAALTMLVSQLAIEWAPLGIRANVVCPGSIDTPMNQLSSLPTADRERIVAGFPARRMGTAAEIGAVVAFLASRGASYVTGQNVIVDGALAPTLR